jgi:O-antigen/teichoic acid export membrane protein
MFKNIIEKYKYTTRTKQLVSLFSTNLLGIPFGIVTSIIITRYLGSQGYGDFKFILSVFNFAIIICNLGLFQAGSRGLVLNNDHAISREYYGAVLIILFGLFIITSILLLFYALFDHNIQEKNLSKVLLYLIPLSWVLLLSKYFESLFQADNQILMLSQIRIYPQFSFLITSIVTFYFFEYIEFNRLDFILVTYFATQAVTYLVVLKKIKVSFKNFQIRINEIWNYNMSFGIDMYLGTIFSLGFATLTEVLISYFGENNSNVGFYSLALTIAMPLTYIPATIATAYYKDFSMSNKISRKLLSITFTVSILVILFLWILIGPIVQIFYGREFINVVRLFYTLSIAVLLHGFGDFINSFLSANGQGKSLRNCLVIYGISILVFNFLLIPNLGPIGASFSKLFSSIVYLISMWTVYINYKKREYFKKNLIVEVGK